MVELAKQYFCIHPDCNIEVAKAETLIAETDDKFDLAIIDLFAQSKNAACVYDREFYRQLKRCLISDAWLSLNVIPNNESDLLAVLLPLREHFHHVAMAKVPQRENIVLVATNLADCDLKKPDQGLAAFGFDVRELLDEFTLLPPAGRD